MTTNRSNNRKEDAAPVNKSALLVSIFMATALVGCGETPPRTQTAPVSPASQSAVSAQPAGQAETASDTDAPPYGGAQKDYCQDANNDGKCDDSGENYDKQYAYTHDGHTYYGRSSSVSAGVLAAGALAGAALCAAALSTGKPAPPVVPSSQTAVSQPYTGPEPKNEKPSTGTSASSTPTTSVRSGSFNSNSGSDVKTSTNGSGNTAGSTSTSSPNTSSTSKSSSASTGSSSSSASSVKSSSSSSSSGISSGISGSKGGLGSSSSSSGSSS